jgi:hypothetical protein
MTSPKADLLDYLIESGVVFYATVTVALLPGGDLPEALPEYLHKELNVTLRLGQLDPPIDGLAVKEDEDSAYLVGELSFRGESFWCEIPLEAINAITLNYSEMPNDDFRDPQPVPDRQSRHLRSID